MTTTHPTPATNNMTTNTSSAAAAAGDAASSAASIKSKQLAGQYVVTAHRAGSVLRMVKCSFLEPNSKVRLLRELKKTHFFLSLYFSLYIYIYMIVLFKLFSCVFMI